MVRQSIKEEFIDSQALFIADMDDAIIGYDYMADRVIYSSRKCISILERDNKWSYMDALTYFVDNIECLYKGNYAPLFAECFERML